MFAWHFETQKATYVTFPDSVVNASHCWSSCGCITLTQWKAKLVSWEVERDVNITFKCWTLWAPCMGQVEENNNYINQKQFAPLPCRANKNIKPLLLSLTSCFQSKCLSTEYQSMKSLLHSHGSKHTHEKCDFFPQVKQTTPFLCVKSFLFLYLYFLWNPFLFLYSYPLFLSWSSSGQILFLCSFLWSILYLLVLLCPWAQVLNPKKSRCARSWSTAPGCFSSARKC